MHFSHKQWNTGCTSCGKKVWNVTMQVAWMDERNYLKWKKRGWNSRRLNLRRLRYHHDTMNAIAFFYYVTLFCYPLNFPLYSRQFALNTMKMLSALLQLKYLISKHSRKLKNFRKVELFLLEIRYVDVLSMI